MIAARDLAVTAGKAAACRALGVSRATFYRRDSQRETPFLRLVPRPSPRRMPDPERRGVLEVLHCERFVDKAPAQVCATLLDEGNYLCSERTMYRLLQEADEVRERRNQLRHPPAAKPQLVATAPNQVWSWDITKLPGPYRGILFYLYVVLDIFSRYVVGWMLAHRESAELAQRLLRAAFERAPQGALPAPRGLDQPACTTRRERGGCTLNSATRCLTLIDRFRTVTMTHTVHVRASPEHHKHQRRRQ